MRVDSARFRCMSVHETARRGFANAADVYEESRPSYPQAAVDWLADQLELRPRSTVVDLAAGTGKLTRLLTPTGATVIAIEPVDEMRDALRRTTPDRRRPPRHRRADRPSRSGSADAVTVAQAFHWFDGPDRPRGDPPHPPPGRPPRPRLEHPRPRRPDPAARSTTSSPLTAATPPRTAAAAGATRSTRPSSSRPPRSDTSPTPRPSTPNRSSAASPPPASSPTSPTPSERRVLDRARAIAADLPDRFPFPYTTEIEILERR